MKNIRATDEVIASPGGITIVFDAVVRGAAGSIAFILRLVQCSHPPKIIFDTTARSTEVAASLDWIIRGRPR